VEAVPVARRADHVPDQLDEDPALIAALQAELAAEVAELAELAAAEAGHAAAEAQVGRRAAGGPEPTAAEAVKACDAGRPAAGGTHPGGPQPGDTADGSQTCGAESAQAAERAQRAERPEAPEGQRTLSQRLAEEGLAAGQVKLLAEDLEVLLQPERVDRTRNGSHQVGHGVNSDGLLEQLAVRGRHFDELPANDVRPVDLGQQQPHD